MNDLPKAIDTAFSGLSSPTGNSMADAEKNGEYDRLCEEMQEAHKSAAEVERIFADCGAPLMCEANHAGRLVLTWNDDDLPSSCERGEIRGLLLELADAILWAEEEL